MILWEHFDHLELNPLKGTVGRTPPLHAHLFHPDFRTGPRMQPEAHTDETPGVICLFLVIGRYHQTSWQSQ